MSLIMDALKKAQQLRLKGQKDSSFTEPPLGIVQRRKVKKYSLIFIIVSATLIISFFLGYKVLPLLTSYQKQRVVSEVLPLQKEKPLPLMSSFSEEKKEEPALKQPVKQKKISKVKTTAQTVVSASGSQKKEAPSGKLPDLGQEAEKERPLVIDVLTYFNSGVDLYRQREIPKAIQAYQKVIELDPMYAEAYNNLGIIYQDIGDFDKAIEAYQKAIEVNPQYMKAYNNLGILLFLNNRYEESTQAFQKALEINPGNIESYINLGILLKKQGEFKKAIECFQKALAINPFNGETHYNIGMLYEQLEDYNLAIGHYQKFIQLSSKTYPVLVSKVQRHVDYLIAVKEGKEKGK